MRYIIMADGKGSRWQNHRGVPKHLADVGGETILARTVRLLRSLTADDEILITSHDPRYEVPGAVRYEPQRNVLEIDRFTAELIDDNVCFLYGDTYYQEAAMRTIVETPVPQEMLFFGNARSIVAIKVADGALFRQHVDRVRALYLAGEIDRCIGWQVYQSYVGLPFGEKRIADRFVEVGGDTEDFNTPQEYDRRNETGWV